MEQPWIKEIDMNPVLVAPEGVIAVDARVILHDAATDESKLPRSAIRPYPTQYMETWELNDGTGVTLRPIRPEDEPLMVKFHETLSEESVRNRYFLTMKLGTRTAHERLMKVCFNDYDREMALVAENAEKGTGIKRIIGVGRLSRVRGRNEAEFALIVSDHWQNRGLGTKLLTTLIDIARKEKLERIMGFVLPENIEMQRICGALGFRAEEGGDVVRVELEL
jgi:acetyltransferase